MTDKAKKMRVDDETRLDKKLRQVQDDFNRLNQKYTRVLRDLRSAEREVAGAVGLGTPQRTYSIKKHHARKSSESTVVVLASDWHIEEEVRPENVNDLNEFNLAVARQRAEQFFQHALHMTEIEQKNTAVTTMVLALLGDFISGNIHEELLETCLLPPIDAAILAQDLLRSGIDFLLDNSSLKLIIPCVVGNHSRITAKSRNATEQGNSLEKFIYQNLALHYKGNPRVQFIIPDSYFCFIEVYGMTLRFHHGHSIRYQGGVGGLTIPLNKAIAQWNKAKHADFDFAGHWHQMFDNGNAVMNGSMIGYNAYAVRIKAGFERPSQAFIVLNSKWCTKVCVRPILFS